MNKKIKVIGLFILKGLFKIGVVTAGATAFTNPVSATIAGVSAVASAISSVTKDKNFKPAMKIVNILDCSLECSLKTSGQRFMNSHLS